MPSEPAPATLSVEQMRAEHWPAVERIYAQGLATGNASFETETPSWEEFQAGHLPGHLLVALDADAVRGVGGAVAGFRPLRVPGCRRGQRLCGRTGRGCGVGRALLTQLTRRAESAGIWTVQAGIFPENTASIALAPRLRVSHGRTARATGATRGHLARRAAARAAREHRVTIGLARQALAELIGTFALVFAGCGAIMVDATTHALGHVGVAISFGLVIMVMIYAVGHISGAHFNPAVTFAFALTRHFPWRRAAVYWPAQLAGALAAALVLRGSLGNVAHVGATLPSGSDGQAFLWESVLTFFLMFVIMAVATDTRAVGEAAAIAIGGTVGLDAMFGGPITGASMNPARSLGPAIAGGDYTAIWVYIAAPLLGAAVAAAVYQFLRAEARPHVAEQSPAARDAA